MLNLGVVSPVAFCRPRPCPGHKVVWAVLASGGQRTGLLWASARARDSRPPSSVQAKMPAVCRLRSRVSVLQRTVSGRRFVPAPVGRDFRIGSVLGAFPVLCWLRSPSLAGGGPGPGLAHARPGLPGSPGLSPSLDGPGFS